MDDSFPNLPPLSSSDEGSFNDKLLRSRSINIKRDTDSLSNNMNHLTISDQSTVPDRVNGELPLPVADHDEYGIPMPGDDPYPSNYAHSTYPNHFSTNLEGSLVDSLYSQPDYAPQESSQLEVHQQLEQPNLQLNVIEMTGGYVQTSAPYLEEQQQIPLELHQQSQLLLQQQQSSLMKMSLDYQQQSQPPLSPPLVEQPQPIVEPPPPLLSPPEQPYLGETNKLISNTNQPLLPQVDEPPPPADKPIVRTERGKSKSTKELLPEIPLPPTPDDINLSDYDLEDKGFTKEEVYEYIKMSKVYVICNGCGNRIKMIETFGKSDEEYYVCIPCSIIKHKDRDIRNYDWEKPEKSKDKSKEKSKEKSKKKEYKKNIPFEGYKRCGRMAHYKPNWSFLERNKQKGKNRNNVRKNKMALKEEIQCLYCRNFKRRQNLKKKMKAESGDLDKIISKEEEFLGDGEEEGEEEEEEYTYEEEYGDEEEDSEE